MNSLGRECIVWLLTLLALTGAGYIESRVTARVVSRRIKGNALTDNRLLRRDAVLVGRGNNARGGGRINIRARQAGIVERCSLILGLFALICLLGRLAARE